MKTTSIGVIGCGYWGPNLLRNFAENEAAQLRWVCDVDEVRMASMSRRYPFAQTASDYRKLLDDPELDAVAVVTPVATHYQIAKEFLRAGKHVLLEKPLTATIAEAEELISQFKNGDTSPGQETQPPEPITSALPYVRNSAFLVPPEL